MPSVVLVKDLATELGLDRSNLRKYAIKHGFSFVKTRTIESAGQTTLAFYMEDAEAIRELRQAQGFTKTGEPINQNSDGFFYAIQTVPDLDPLRVKLGFAADVNARINTHRTTSPTAILMGAWPCKKPWEIAAIASITRIGCRTIGYEVFACDDIDALIQRAESFFVLMPA